MNISNPTRWNEYVESNKDGYGSGVVRFAERWADLMEAHIAEGKTLDECAQATSSEADTEGITGFMFGAAAAMLTQCWAHGEELRRWHNKYWDAESANDTPGAVVNPAIITIDTSR